MQLQNKKGMMDDNLISNDSSKQNATNMVHEERQR